MKIEKIKKILEKLHKRAIDDLDRFNSSESFKWRLTFERIKKMNELWSKELKNGK